MKCKLYIKGSEKACRIESSFTLVNPILPQTTQEHSPFPQNVVQCLLVQLWEMPSASIPAVPGARLFVLESRPGHSRCPLWTLPASRVQSSSTRQAGQLARGMNQQQTLGSQRHGTETVFSELQIPRYGWEVLWAPSGQGLGGNRVSCCETEGLAGPCHQALGTSLPSSRSFFSSMRQRRMSLTKGFGAHLGLWTGQYIVK